MYSNRFVFFFQAEDGIRGPLVTGVQTCALPIYSATPPSELSLPSPESVRPSYHPGVSQFRVLRLLQRQVELLPNRRDHHLPRSRPGNPLTPDFALIVLNLHRHAAVQRVDVFQVRFLTIWVEHHEADFTLGFIQVDGLDDHGAMERHLAVNRA